jgi:hypothetical protein
MRASEGRFAAMARRGASSARILDYDACTLHPTNNAHKARGGISSQSSGTRQQTRLPFHRRYSQQPQGKSVSRHHTAVSRHQSSAMGVSVMLVCHFCRTSYKFAADSESVTGVPFPRKIQQGFLSGPHTGLHGWRLSRATCDRRT